MANDDLKPVPQTQNDPQAPRALSRRQALTRLGLAAGTAYAAPTLLSLKDAKAGPPWGGPSGPGHPGNKDKE